jgi:hypothetical protein
LSLRDIGITPSQESIYRLLLADATIAPAQLVEQLRLDVRVVQSDLAALRDLGVIRIDDGLISVPHPSMAVGRLIEKLEDELMARYRQVSDTRSQLAQFEAELAERHGDPASDNGVERVEELGAVRDRIEELAFFARKSVLSIQPGGPPTREALEASRPLDLRAARRQVAMSVIHETAALGDELNRAHLRELAALGVNIRLVEKAPHRLLIFDDEVAVVPIEPDNSRRGALVVRHPGLLAGLIDLYRRTWAVAEEIPAELDGEPRTVEPDDEITEQDRMVLRMLAAGCTDETAARQVGVSVRHLRRRISRLMLILEANSRFEAGVAAAHRGWL